jgi:hypothetical protein
MGWYERWAQWAERYRFLVDLFSTLLTALVVVTLAAQTAQSFSVTELEAVLVSAAVLAPLPWSRTRPVASCVAMFLICMLQVTALGMPVLLPADLAVLASMYCVTVYGPRWAYLMACGMAVVGAVAVGLALWVVNGGGSLLPALPGMVLVSTLLACAFAFGLVRRSRRSMLLAMRDRAERLEVERDQQAQIATAAERARIAREMHDIVAHSLSVVIAQADGGRYAATADPAAAQRSLGTIAETGRAALADMRRLLGVLREDQPSGTPSRRRMSASAARPVSAMVPRERWAAAGSAAAAYRPPSACAMITDREWATMSCISRAMRARSAAVAICACWSRSISRRSARSRSASIIRRRDLRTRPNAKAQPMIASVGTMRTRLFMVGESLRPRASEPITAMPQAVR